MKQRITYIVKNPESFTPSQISVQNDAQRPSFTLTNVDAVKEHRLTLGLDELPKEISKLLQQWHELHIRWASDRPYAAIPPFTSRVSPGLHLFFTPLPSTPDDAFCAALHSFVSPGLKCASMGETAIKMPVLSERFRMSASWQYYAYLEDMEAVGRLLRGKVCGEAEGKGACEDWVRRVGEASYVDVDYDTISRTVVVTAVWDSDGEEGWNDTILLPSPDATVEIGVLNHESNADAEDIQFGGFLTVLGQDDRPKATRFQTPTRHYPLLLPSTSASEPPTLHPLTYTTSLNQPTGLHPTLTLTLPAQHLTPPSRTCKLHAHLTLPSYLFIDKYQFTDPLFLASHKLASLRSLSGATDLEAPDWVVQQCASAALFELVVPEPERIPLGPIASRLPEYGYVDDLASYKEVMPTGDWNVSISLHLRYLPAATRSHERVPVPWSVVFWACRADAGAQHPSNPFDRTHLGYEGLFGPKTRFMHVEPSNGTHMVEWIDVPVLDTRRAGWVEGGTVGVVVLAFLGLCWVLFGGNGNGRRREEGKGQGKKTQ
ncbi:PIG-X-domain-containing protein [Decorospora gaudefroyi]|uniref:Protein PBN1 n=1 Tax=Decorospora gaudefroyi TaxID=184978 RepID=A0A6A5KP82_9PLEO|nr:PIG-X-domain-containing protein [Decorospora gaudefroyi]